jgi:hypothetical protein
MELVKKCHAYGKPAAVYTPNATHKTTAYREKYDVPLFESPEEAVRALSVSFRQYGYSFMKEDADRKTSVHARVRRSDDYSDYAAEA